MVFTYLGNVSEGEDQQDPTNTATTAATGTTQQQKKKTVSFKEAKAAKNQEQACSQRNEKSTARRADLPEGEKNEGEENPRRATCAIHAIEASETQTDVEDFRQAGRRWRGDFPDEALLKRCHDGTHPSFTVTWRRIIRATGIGPGLEQAKLKEQVKRYCNACLTCQKLQPARARVEARLGTIRQRPFSELAFDIIVLNAPDVDDNRYILTVIDSFSRAVELFPLKRASAEMVTICLHDVLCRWGRPHRVRCDNA
jgi:hypothetical protein